MVEKAAAREFGANYNVARKQVDDLKTASFSTPEDAFNTIIAVSDALAKAYDAALVTANKDDDSIVLARLSDAQNRIEALINKMPNSPTKQMLKDYLPARLSVFQAISAKPITSIQIKIASDRLAELKTLRNDIVGKNAAVGALATKDIVSFQRLIQSKKEVLPNIVGLGEEDLDQAADFVRKELPLLGGNAVKGSDWLDEVQHVINDINLNRDKGRAPQGDTDELKDIQVFLAKARKDATTNDQLRVVANFELLVNQVLHEYAVSVSGARTDVAQRELFRPSIDPAKIDKSIAGPAMAFIGHYGDRLNKAEAMALLIATTDPDKRAGLLDDEKTNNKNRAFLEKLRNDLSDYSINQDLNAIIGGASSPAVELSLNNMRRYISSYISWIDNLLDVTESAPDTVGGVNGPEGNKKRTIYDDKIDDSIAGFLHDFITNTYPTTAFADVTAAFERKERELNASGQEDLANAIMYSRILHEFGVYNATGTGPLNIDYLTVRMDKLAGTEAQPGPLRSKEGLGFYDSLRDTDFYKKIIKKMSNQAYLTMLDTTDGNPFYAANDWDTSSDLFNATYDKLYTSDAAFKAAIDAFPEANKFREDIVKLIKRSSQYDASVRDLRTKAAAVALGYNRSAFKHADGQSVEAWGWELQMAYKIAKNSDRGKYATALGWVELPKDLIEGGDKPSPEEKKEQTETLKDTNDEFYAYIEEVFGKKRAEKELHHKKWHVNAKYKTKPPHFGGFPTLDDFLSVDPKGRKSGNNMANFLKAQENTLKIYDLASNSWAETIKWEKDPGKFRNQVNEKLVKMNTMLSMAYSTSTDNPEQKAELLKSLAAACNFYLVYLLAQIPRDHNKFWDADYREKYGIFVKEAKRVFNKNGSLVVKMGVDSRGAKIPNFSFRDSFIKTVESTAFRKGWVRNYELGMLVPYNVKRLKRAGIDHPEFSNHDALTAHVENPFLMKSDTSSHEKAA